jgi:hypothetical protein
MAEPYCGVEIHFYVFGRYISVSTPDWNREYHLPSWLPKWKFETIDDIPCRHSKWFHFDWFFHIAACYGPPSSGLNPETEKYYNELSPEEKERLERLYEQLKNCEPRDWPWEELGDLGR